MNKNSKGIRTILIVVILGAIAAVGYLALRSLLTSSSTLSHTSPTPTPPPIDESGQQKTFVLENISFKYPGEWKPPETFDTNFGLAGSIESADGEYVIRVLTGLNKGHTPEENEKFIEDFSLEGGKKLTIGGINASSRALEYGGTRAITAYVLSKNKDSTYSISISSKADNKNVENLFNQILSTLQFSD